MSNNTVTLSKEIKKLLHPRSLALFTGVMFLCSVISLLLLFAIDPLAMSKGVVPMAEYVAIMTGITVGIVIGMVFTIAVGKFFTPKVMRYVDAPHEIESVKDGLIALGAFVTTIENTVNAKQIANIFYNISKRFKKVESRVTHLEENELNYNRIIKDQRKLIFNLEMRLKDKDLDKELTKKLKVELQGALETIAKSNERITQLEKKIKELGDK